MAGLPPTPFGSDSGFPVLDRGTGSLMSCPAPSSVCASRTEALHDELTPIARYMAGEMNTNAGGADVRRMAELNATSGRQCIAEFTRLPLWRQVLGLGITPEQCQQIEISSHMAALLDWAVLVRQDGPWDHKPLIARRFHPRAPAVQHWHLYRDTLYFYDVWSNLHYGYVGRAAGFSDAQLLDGAGLEQIGSNLLRGNLTQGSSGVGGLRRYDNPEDRVAIEAGMALQRRRPSQVKASDLMSWVVNNPRITTKPYAP
ncbi:polymorphic toxin type 44 domain-containing protein [Ideonella sp. A 288]|uniref:polymorphic toxin type 44 domain-containing protein n=1 Tax=Ideonella sp. A 288 TaxID=1962181 RepID=UPI000B4B14B8|nr:polymorphic toxin type 44 domain-containing protein [Ideonella sp. A 288]